MIVFINQSAPLKNTGVRKLPHEPLYFVHHCISANDCLGVLLDCRTVVPNFLIALWTRFCLNCVFFLQLVANFSEDQTRQFFFLLTLSVDGLDQLFQVGLVRQQSHVVVVFGLHLFSHPLALRGCLVLKPPDAFLVLRHPHLGHFALPLSNFGLRVSHVVLRVLRRPALGLPVEVPDELDEQSDQASLIHPRLPSFTRHLVLYPAQHLLPT